MPLKRCLLFLSAACFAAVAIAIPTSLPALAEDGHLFGDDAVATVSDRQDDQQQDRPTPSSDGDVDQSPEDGFYFIWATTAPNLVLGTSGDNFQTGSLSRIRTFNWSVSQLYKVEHITDEWSTITCSASGDVLTAGNSIDGSSVYLSEKQAIYNQQWHIEENDDGTWSFYPRNAKSKALDVSGASKAPNGKIQLWSSNGTKAQKFALVHWTPADDAAKTGSTSVPTGYTTIKCASRKSYSLDVAANSMSDGANIQIWSSNSTFAQKWLVLYRGNGLYTIQNAGSMAYMDLAYAFSDNGANISQHSGGNTLNQMWYFEQVGSSYAIRSAVNGKALDIAFNKYSNGSNIHLWERNSLRTQEFEVKWADLVGSGTYTIQTAISKPMVLDIAGASRSDYANVETWRSLGNSAQKFTISSLGGGYYSMKNPSSSKYLTANGIRSGSNVYQRTWDGSNRQKWLVSAAGNNRVSFYNVASGKALDVSGASRLRGANVGIWDGNGTDAQEFNLLSDSWSFYGKTTPAVISKAEQYEGWAYRWGGKSPSTSFDCSGLVTYCANSAAGKRYDVNGTNASMLYFKCQPISREQARPGDLVFFQGTYGGNVNYISHVGFYCGDGVMFAAGDPIAYYDVDDVWNIRGQRAAQLYARMV